MQYYTFPKELRLRNRREFREVYDAGNTARSRFFVLFYLRRREDRPARLGITVGRKFGKAVQRNRMKRLIREAFRHLQHGLEPGVDIVINVRYKAEGLTQNQVSTELSSLFHNAGLLCFETN